MLDELNSKLNAAKKDSDKKKRRYWKIRIATIEYLGGVCACGESNVNNLEIHHVEPHLDKYRPGGQRLKDWKQIITGKLPAKLCCKNCHLNEHGGNTNSLKRLK